MYRHALPLLLAFGCASAAEEDDNPFRDPVDAPDALVSGPGEDPGGGLTNVRLLFFKIGADGWLASAAGTEARMVCPDADMVPDAEGTRVLCVPDTHDAPLRLYDVELSEVVVEFEDWVKAQRSPPALSPDGSKVAVRAFSEGQDVARVYGDGGNIVEEVQAFDMLGFASNDTLLIDRNSTAVWRLRDEPWTVTGSSVRPVGPDPAGAVYELSNPAFHAYFLDGVDGMTRALGEGKIGAVFGTRVLIRTPDKMGHLVDVADEAFSEVLSLPTPKFDQVPDVALTLLSRSVVLSAVQTAATCGAMQQRVAAETRWHHITQGESVVVGADDGTPHRADVNLAGTLGLVMDIDPCGAPLGTGRLIDLGQERVERELSEWLEAPVLDARLSPDGRFVALATEDGLQVLDLSNDMLREAATGGKATALRYR